MPRNRALMGKRTSAPTGQTAAEHKSAHTMTLRATGFMAISQRPRYAG